MAGPHYYPIDPSVYCRIATRVRTNVFEDADLVGGNVELFPQWGGGYIEYDFHGAAGTALGTGRLIGIGGLGSTWQSGATTWKVNGNGGLYGPGVGSELIPSGSDAQQPWANRGSTIDVSFDIAVGSVRGGITLRGNSSNCFWVVAERSSNKLMVYRRVSDVNTAKLTSTVTLTPGLRYTVRVTVTADVWTVYIDGVSQGSFTDATFNTKKTSNLVSYDADTIISNLAFQPSVTCPATTYEVVNDSGVAVVSGAVSGYKIIVPDSSLVQRDGLGPRGGYKLRLTGADKLYYGTAAGDCQFVRVRTDPAFAAKPAYYSTPSSPGGSAEWDVGLRSFFGLGATRIRSDETGFAATAAYLRTNYTAAAPSGRPRYVIGHFHDSTANAAAVTAFVAANPTIDAWEGRNEPDATAVPTYLTELQAFHAAVKAGNPAALVLGPNPVTYNDYLTHTGPGNSEWLQAVLAVGAQYLDGLTVHGYNCTNGDISMSKRLLDRLQAIAAPYGLPLWQTEQSFNSQLGNVCIPAHAIRWTAVQLMVQETRGIPLERNVLWYDLEHGFNGATNFWQTDLGVTGVPVLVRTMAAEIGGRVFASEYDLGDQNDVYVCAKWAGTDGSATVGVLAQSKNLPDVRFYLTGAESVECCDGYGNEFSLTRGVRGIITVPASDLPTWVRLPVGVDLTLVASDWSPGDNLLTGATVTTSSAGPAYNLANLVSQALENGYGFGSGVAFNSADPAMDTSQSFPQTITATLAAPAVMSLLVLYAPAVWQTRYSTPTDFDLAVNTAAGWQTVLTQAPEPSTGSAFVSDLLGNNTTQDQWFNPPVVWVASFDSVAVSAVRLVIRNVSWGGHETAAASTAVWDGAAQWVCLRGLRGYEGNGTLDPAELYFLANPVLATPAGADRVLGAPSALFRRYRGAPREATVLKIDGAYVTVREPTVAQIAAATEVYLGGHVNEVTLTQGAALVAAGYQLRSTA